ncbi:hypothetical protein OSC03_02845 [Morganella morganii]|uniref:hypothetical protein n=1 Tax=Morganella morganii TaxID=582 RepID=UPI0028744A75|nr:hypothetical protein [Morganella morganii]MDS0905949.1 hypothetical protein [Morganella morganii]
MAPSDDTPSKNDKKSQVAVVEKVLENQRLEIEAKNNAQQVRLKEIESNEKLALSSIAAQERVHTALVKRETTNIAIRIGGFIIAFVSILLFIGYAITHDAKDLVLDLVKMFVPLVIGCVGGFYAGKYKGKTEDEE